MKKIFFATLGILVFTSCTLAPVYKTTYSFAEPKDQGERTCIAQCKSAKSVCNRTCERDYQKCEDDNERNYRIDSEQCARDVKAGLKKSFDCPARYKYGRHCTKECGCEVDYVDCYKTCGLTVTSQQVCVQNCDQKK